MFQIPCMFGFWFTPIMITTIIPNLGLLGWVAASMREWHTLALPQRELGMNMTSLSHWLMRLQTRYCSRPQQTITVGLVFLVVSRKRTGLLLGEDTRGAG